MPAQTKPEMRIVSLAPSATSILCAIGGRRLLVGVTKWCCDVAPVAGLPQVGDCWHLESVADVVKLRPTLVIGSVPYKQETVGKLLEQRVYCEAWPNPRISSPPWVAELVKICGGEMIVPAGGKVTDAQMAEARPEVIVLAWAATGGKSDPEQAYRVEAWKDVPAIRERRVFVVPDELLNTPGPPLMRGVLELWKVLHRKKEIKR